MGGRGVSPVRDERPSNLLISTTTLGLLTSIATLIMAGAKGGYAATLLGIGRNTLTRKVQELKIDASE